MSLTNRDMYRGPLYAGPERAAHIASLLSPDPPKSPGPPIPRRTAAYPQAYHPQKANMTTAQAQYGQPRIRINETIPAGVSVTSKSDPRMEYVPPDGPMGFGIYRESDESPEIIDFWPVVEDNRSQPYLSQVQPAASAAPQWQPMPFPYAPPQPKPPSPPPDLIDPNFIEWWREISTQDLTTMAPHYKTAFLEGKILPLRDYISQIKGPTADLYKQDLTKRAEMLACGKQEEEVHDEKWFAEQRRGMAPEDYEPVSHADEVTDWRKKGPGMYREWQREKLGRRRY